jgi:DNA polymerase
VASRAAAEAPAVADQASAGTGQDGAPDEALRALRAEVLKCTRCKLHQGRRTVVFGEGNPRPDVMFVGEAPGSVEDQTGRPFVGPAGQLLDRIIAGAMGLHRSEVFIGNVNKCRPPGNRDPEPDEVAACLPYLRRQVALLQPKVIVALGRIAAHNLLSTTEPMRALRGRELRYDGIPVVVTWHPAFLLRDPSHKRETWDDIKRVNRLLGRPEVPEARST